MATKPDKLTPPEDHVKKRILSIDNSVISYVAWYRMHGKNFQNQTSCEVTEFTRNYAELMHYIQTIYKPDKTIILMDCTNPIWRNKYQLDYYIQYSRAFKHKEKKGIEYLLFDGKTFPMRYAASQERWLIDNALTKKTYAEVKWDDFEEISLDEHHIDNLPHYKGNRSKVWNFGTDRQEYKKRANDVAFSYAPLMDAVCIQKQSIEADDLAFMVVMYYPWDEHIMATNDSDWRQLSLIGDVKYYDPRDHKLIDDKEDVYRYNFYTKLIGGDSGDNVPGAWLLKPGATKEPFASKYAEKSAQNLIDKIGLDKTLEYVFENKTPSMQRNIEMISLKQSFRYLTRSGFDFGDIGNQILHKKVETTHLTIEDFHTTQTALNIASADARRSRKDVAAGMEF